MACSTVLICCGGPPEAGQDRKCSRNRSLPVDPLMDGGKTDQQTSNNQLHPSFLMHLPPPRGGPSKSKKVSHSTPPGYVSYISIMLKACGRSFDINLRAGFVQRTNGTQDLV